MRFFMDKLSQQVPVIKRKNEMLTGIPNAFVKTQYAIMEGISQKEYYDLPYLQPIRAYFEAGGSIGEQRFLLVTENETLAIKAALGLILYAYMDIQADFFDFLSQQGHEMSAQKKREADDVFKKLKLVDLSADVKDEKNTSNLYIQKTLDITESSIALYWGLTDNEFLNDKLDIILTSEARVQFVMVSANQLEKPWMREVMMDRDYEILSIPELGIGYYEGVLQSLLEGERYVLAEDVEPGWLIRSIMKKRGRKFSEEDIAWSMDQAIKRAEGKQDKYVLQAEDFIFTDKEEKSASERLQEMIGLESVKIVARECAALLQEQLNNNKIKSICKHMIFAGRPGTGKTECAGMLAEIMADEAQNNGVFVEATRKDIIAGYIGQTAPKVAKLFQIARNGVLFVDEAGFFLQDSKSGFVQEAIKEFVRYMELYQDVTVIFALYPHEVDDWMELDAGLSSRIGRIVTFPDYMDKELLEIAEYMCMQRGYSLDKAAKPKITAYIKDRKAVQKDNFGNAREMRKLVESAIFAKSLRCYNQPLLEKDFCLRASDFEDGMMRLRQETKKKQVIGFVTEQVKMEGAI